MSNYSKLDTNKIEEKNIFAPNLFAPNLSSTFLNTYPIYDNLIINANLENNQKIYPLKNLMYLKIWMQEKK